MAAIDDLLVAFDSYMKTNAKPGSPGGKYLAGKLSAIFEDTNSPFSTKRGSVLDTLSKKLAKLGTKIATIADSKALDDVVKGLANLNKSFNGVTSTKSKSNNVDAKSGNDTKALEMQHKGFKLIIDILRNSNSPSYRAHRLNDLFKGLRTNLYLSRGIKVDIVSMDRDVLARMGKVFEKAAIAAQEEAEEAPSKIKEITTFNKLSSWLASSKKSSIQEPYKSKDDRKDEKDGSPKGILSTIWSWVKTIGMILGVFEIGKGLFHGKNLATSIKDGFDDIGDMFSGIFKIFTNWNGKDKKKIDKNSQDAKDGIWGNIKKFLDGLDWGKMLSTTGHFLYDTIIYPIFSSIGESLSKGDFMGAAGKGLMALIAASVTVGLIPGFGLLLGGFTNLVGGFTKLVGGFTKLGSMLVAGGPLMLVLVALGAAFIALKMASDEVQVEIDKSKVLDGKVLKVTEKKINDGVREVKRLEAIPYKTAQEKTELDKQRLMLERNRNLAKKTHDIARVNDETSGWFGQLTDSFATLVDDHKEGLKFWIGEGFTKNISDMVGTTADSKIRDINAASMDKESAISKSLAGVPALLARRTRVENDANTIADSIRANRRAAEQTRGQFSTTNNNNPIIIQTAKPVPVADRSLAPISQKDADEILAALGGLGSAVHELKDATVTGQAANIQASNAITQAVIATAPLPPAPSNGNGGGDPIQRQRIKSNAAANNNR